MLLLFLATIILREYKKLLMQPTWLLLWNKQQMYLFIKELFYGL